MGPLGAGDPRQVAGFRLRARLGAGGMGRVYLGFSLAGRAVAVKVIRAELATDAEFVRRFAAEVAAARLVSGLYTAPVVADGTGDDPPWLATAYVPAPSLDELVGAAGPLPLSALWRLAAGTAEALEAIHGCGLVHRDLKPGNVLIAADGPRVIDFGIARALEATALTGTGVVIGTVGYLPPEQVTGGESVPAGDVFSLGCVLAFAATGASPFALSPGTPAAAALYQVAHGDPDLTRVPEPLRGLVAQCLSRDPAGRPDPGEVAARAAAALDEVTQPGAFWPTAVTAAVDDWRARHPLPPSAALAPGSPAAPLEPQSPTTHPATAPAVDAGAPAAEAARDTASMAMPTPAAVQPGQAHAKDGTAAPGPIPGSPPGRTVSRRLLLTGLGGASAAAAAAYTGVSLAGGGGSSHRSLLSATARPPSPSRTPSHTPIASLNPGEQAWVFEADTVLHQHGMAFAGGTVYFVDENGTGYAVDAASGRKVWAQKNVGTAFAGQPPAVAGGLVFFPGGPTGLAAFDAATGKPTWKTPSGKQYAVVNWAVDDGKIYFTAVNGALYILDAATGKQMKRYSLPLAPHAATGDAPLGFAGPIAASGGIFYALPTAETEANTKITAFRASDGAVVWRNADTIGLSSTNPVVSGGVLYAGTSDGTQGNLYALDAASGRTRWAYPYIANIYFGTPVLGNGLICAVDYRNTLHAVHASTGRRAWTTKVDSFTTVPPVVSADVVYVMLSDKGGPTALSVATGAKLLTLEPSNGYVTDAVAAAGDLVYVAMDRYVFALSAAARASA